MRVVRSTDVTSERSGIENAPASARGSRLGSFTVARSSISTLSAGAALASPAQLA